MRILAIGGTGFIGQPVARELLAAGHRVTMFHRGTARVELPDAEEIVGNRNRLADFRDQFSCRKFDVVLDFLLSDGRQAQELIQVFRGIAGRIVAISSCDVYRAYGLIRQRTRCARASSPHGRCPAPLHEAIFRTPPPIRTDNLPLGHRRLRQGGGGASRDIERRTTVDDSASTDGLRAG